jgi:hypothetical protein
MPKKLCYIIIINHHHHQQQQQHQHLELERFLVRLFWHSSLQDIMGGIVDCGITFCPVFPMLRLCWKLDDSLPLSVVDASGGGGRGVGKGNFAFSVCLMIFLHILCCCLCFFLHEVLWVKPLIQSIPVNLWSMISVRVCSEIDCGEICLLVSLNCLQSVKHFHLPAKVIQTRCLSSGM